MKKRMFITTIVMMLVLAVALTTSSLAWFSSANTSVTANAATFTAAAASSSNVNLKISDTLGGWGNQIGLTSGGATMAALVPTAPLISAAEVGADITTTGVTINEAHQDVIHKGYVWPARMAFNGAKIGSESNFIIDDGNNQVNKVTNYTEGSSEGYYYDEFYIHNAGNENTIGSLRFKVDAQLSADTENRDYTARGYAAFILYDLVNVRAGSTVPANALQSANLKVVAHGSTVGEGEIEETDTDEGLNVWVPFAGFTFATKKGATDTYQETDWQFADLDAQTTPGTYDWNNKMITTLPTQQYDALTGTGNDDGFILNSDSLQDLNNKVANPNKVGNYYAGSVRNGETGYVRTENVDTGTTGSKFIMQPGEIFKVAMYYWLDGMSLTEYTDTTVSNVGVVIEASRS